MNKHSKHRNILLSSLDYERICDLLEKGKQLRFKNRKLLKVLQEELKRATIVPPDEIPRYAVTMNTTVRLVDVESNEEKICTLVYPKDEDVTRGRLSILSDTGVAIFGFSVGDTIEWVFPEGVRRLRIDRAYYQPEATKDYDQ